MCLTCTNFYEYRSITMVLKIKVRENQKDNPETMATLGTQDTGQDKQKHNTEN